MIGIMFLENISCDMIVMISRGMICLLDLVIVDSVNLSIVEVI